MSKRDVESIAPLTWNGPRWKMSSAKGKVEELLHHARNDKRPRSIRQTASHRAHIAEQAHMAVDAVEESDEEVECDTHEDDTEETSGPPLTSHQQAIKKAEEAYQTAIGKSKAAGSEKLKAREEVADLRRRISALERAAKQALEKAAEYELEETAQRAEADSHVRAKQSLEALGEYFV